MAKAILAPTSDNCWMPRGRGGYKESMGKSVRRVPVASGQARARAENGFNQLFRRIGRGRRIVGQRKRGLFQVNRLLVAVQISHTPGALGQVRFELGALALRQRAEQVLVQEFSE